MTFDPEDSRNLPFSLVFQTSEHIEQLHIDAKQATLKFKDKTISVNRADFSDSLNKLHKHGYDVLSKDWELVAQGEKETPLQKYHRLQCELKELMDEVSQIKVRSFAWCF